MDNNNEKQGGQNNQQPPESMTSYNNLQENQKETAEETVGKKDESQSYMDYNGNSEQNAPARAREGEE
jgi:hypothetical protein